MTHSWFGSTSSRSWWYASRSYYSLPSINRSTLSDRFCFGITSFRLIKVDLAGVELCSGNKTSVHRGLRYIEVRYIEGRLYTVIISTVNNYPCTTTTYSSGCLPVTTTTHLRVYLQACQCDNSTSGYSSAKAQLLSQRLVVLQQREIQSESCEQKCQWHFR